MLTVTNLRVEIGPTVLVDNANFAVRAKDKVGLVGRNGAGKTSLLTTIAGLREQKSGTIKFEGGVGYLPQDPKAEPGAEARQAVTHILSGRGLDEAMVRIEKLRIALEEDASERNINRYSRALDDFDLKGGYGAESEARKIAAGLGLKADRLDLPLTVLSGGERRRVELSRILFAGSDVLLLDEPTNHLDLDAKEWLLQYLRDYRGALLVISHDLDLLDEAITRVIHLDRAFENSVGGIVEYKGTYTQYTTARAADEERQLKVATMQQREIDRLQTLVNRFGAKASKASMAHSLEKRIVRIENDKVEANDKSKALHVTFPTPPHSGKVTVEIKGLTKSYGGPPIFKDVTFDLGRGDRIFIMGLNGAGKTSLLRILAGQTTADSGDIRWGHDVSAGYYAQEHETLDGDKSLLDNMREMASVTDTEMRNLLGMFGLSGEKAFQDAGTLSGGEKTKLALAQLVAGKHNLLLLDEPTNNLDPSSRTGIANALKRWPGSMILVSHDPEFVTALQPQKVLLMPDGQLDYWNDEYLELVSMS